MKERQRNLYAKDKENVKKRQRKLEDKGIFMQKTKKSSHKRQRNLHAKDKENFRQRKLQAKTKKSLHKENLRQKTMKT